MHNYKGKTILVIGGTSGLGLATVDAFLEVGASVIVASRKEKNIRTDTHFVALDLNEKDSITAVFEEIKKRFDSIDIAINCGAAGTGFGKMLHEFTEEEYEYVMKVNLTGMWRCMKQEIEMMQKVDSPTYIVNVSSVSGMGANRRGGLYGLSKAGVTFMSKTAAVELAKTNIQVQLVVPGPFETPMFRDAVAAVAKGDAEKISKIEEATKKRIPKGAFGKPEEFAAAILWLCSGAADYMVGHPLVLDGGLKA